MGRGRVTQLLTYKKTITTTIFHKRTNIYPITKNLFRKKEIWQIHLHWHCRSFAVHSWAKTKAYKRKDRKVKWTYSTLDRNREKMYISKTFFYWIANMVSKFKVLFSFSFLCFEFLTRFLSHDFFTFLK